MYVCICAIIYDNNMYVYIFMCAVFHVTLLGGGGGGGYFVEPLL